MFFPWNSRAGKLNLRGVWGVLLFVARRKCCDGSTTHHWKADAKEQHAICYSQRALMEKRKLVFAGIFWKPIERVVRCTQEHCGWAQHAAAEVLQFSYSFRYWQCSQVLAWRDSFSRRHHSRVDAVDEQMLPNRREVLASLGFESPKQVFFPNTVKTSLHETLLHTTDTWF